MMKLQMSVCLGVCIKMASNGVKKMGNSQEQLKTKTADNQLVRTEPKGKCVSCRQNSNI